MRHLFPQHAFVSLDLPSAAFLAEENPEEFLRRYPPPVIIDEVQYAPGLFRHLKVAIDRDRATNGRFLLTGSQKFSLMQAVQESLAGRIDILELETLSLHEILHAQAASPLADPGSSFNDLRAMLTGGYPELHARPAIDRQMFYSSFVASYCVFRRSRPLAPAQAGHRFWPIRPSHLSFFSRAQFVVDVV